MPPSIIQSSFESSAKISRGDVFQLHQTICFSSRLSAMDFWTSLRSYSVAQCEYVRIRIIFSPLVLLVNHVPGSNQESSDQQNRNSQCQIIIRNPNIRMYFCLSRIATSPLSTVEQYLTSLGFTASTISVLYFNRTRESHLKIENICSELLVHCAY